MFNRSTLPPQKIAEQLKLLRKNRRWFIGLGAALIILGFIALGSLAMATAVSIVFFGWLLLCAGVIQVVHVFQFKTWGGFFVSIFMGILNICVGLLLIFYPVSSALSLTLLCGIYFIISGSFNILSSLFSYTNNTFWMMLNGIVVFVLGILILKEWPYSGLWVIGLFLAINLIMSGWSSLALAFAVGTLERRRENH